MAVFDGSEIRAADGKLYRFLGKQWAEVLPSGKTGKMATRGITLELDRLAADKYLSTRPSVFDNLLLKGIRSGKIPARTQSAMDWFRNSASKTDVTTRDILKEKTRMVKNSVVGKMYFFQYDPKHAKTLPYYDMFPLIFPIERYSDGFLGINFHYLDLKMRAKLMDELYGIANNDKFDESTKLKVSYGLLKGASQYKYFEPTVHRYLNSHVKSRFIEIESSEWDIALFLPVENFKKKTKSYVQKNSRKKFTKP
jgi:hypothetical protein